MIYFHLCLQVVERKPFQTLAHQEYPLEGGPGLVAFVLEHTPHPNVLHTQAHLHPHFCRARPCRRGPLFRRGVRVPDDLFAGRRDRTERVQAVGTYKMVVVVVVLLRRTHLAQCVALSRFCRPRVAPDGGDHVRTNEGSAEKQNEKSSFPHVEKMLYLLFTVNA